MNFSNFITALLQSFTPPKVKEPVSKPPSGRGNGARRGNPDLTIIKEFEGLRLKAYMPTPNDVPTIGYGHTHGVRMGTKITKSQADAFLMKDVAWAVKAVDTKVKVPLTDNQRSALTSFVFNVGETAFGKSTLLRVLNTGDYSGAANQLLRWDKQKGKTLKGLTRRRVAEKKLFEG